VDDEEVRLKMVETVISGYFKGVTVKSFQDAEEAWQELSRTDPDLLITDDIMGTLNGDEIVRRLADRKVTYPIIVINAYGPERDQWVSDCAKRGVNVTMLRAPFPFESFLRALESCLKISRDTTGSFQVPTESPRTCPPDPHDFEVAKGLLDQSKENLKVSLRRITAITGQEVTLVGANEPDAPAKNLRIVALAVKAFKKTVAEHAKRGLKGG
jgi:DNA-binding response OmpR family regulator